MLCLPNTACQSWYHDHGTLPHPKYVHSCTNSQVHLLLEFFSTTDTEQWIADNGLSKIAALTTYIGRTWQGPLAATLNVHHGNGDGTSDTAVTWDDIHCATCDTYVSKALLPEHWDDICGTCYRHSDDCSCCPTCGYDIDTDGCQCCVTCGQAPGWCECCSYCHNVLSECDCALCRDCGEKTQYCSCYGSDGHASFGSTMKLPWIERTDEPVPFEIPSIAEQLHHDVDPVQAAADFYLLDAIKSGARMNSVTGLTDQSLERYNATRQHIMRADSMLAAVTQAADRSHRNLIDQVLPAFLAYGVAAVGGELRYHKALGRKDKSTGKAILPSSRDKAWNKFTALVQQKGASVLFDADTLFREFGSASYGGEKWGNAAKVVGAYLNGTMPAWLFVDRVFTLQHNGGCFLNKVTWRRSNDLHWGLSNMMYVLNAHASKDMYGEALPNNEVDWELLLSIASPGVRTLWGQSERAIRRIARRFGGDLPRIAESRTVKYVEGRRRRIAA